MHARHILLLPNPWPLTSNQRPKCVVSEAPGLGEECVLERGWEGALSWLLWWGGGGETHPSIPVITCF